MFQSLGEVKLRDVGGWAAKNLSSSKVTQATRSWAIAYGNKYIKTGTAKPLVHVMIGLGVLGYIIEYPHLAGMSFQVASFLFCLTLASTRAITQAPLNIHSLTGIKLRLSLNLGAGMDPRVVCLTLSRSATPLLLFLV